MVVSQKKFVLSSICLTYIPEFLISPTQVNIPLRTPLKAENKPKGSIASLSFDQRRNVDVSESDRVEEPEAGAPRSVVVELSVGTSMSDVDCSVREQGGHERRGLDSKHVRE